MKNKLIIFVGALLLAQNGWAAQTSNQKQTPVKNPVTWKEVILALDRGLYSTPLQKKYLGKQPFLTSINDHISKTNELINFLGIMVSNAIVQQQGYHDHFVLMDRLVMEQPEKFLLLRVMNFLLKRDMILSFYSKHHQNLEFYKEATSNSFCFTGVRDNQVVKKEYEALIEGLETREKDVFFIMRTFKSDNDNSLSVQEIKDAMEKYGTFLEATGKQKAPHLDVLIDPIMARCNEVRSHLELKKRNEK